MDSSSATGSTSTRRGFLRHLMGEARDQLGHFAQEASVGTGRDAPQTPPAMPAARALPASGRLPIDDALGIAEQCGLGRRLEAIRELAVPSLRLTICEPGQITPGASWLGDRPVRPSDVLLKGERELKCLAAIDLAHAGIVLGDERLLPTQGKLWCFAPRVARVNPDPMSSHEYPVVIHRAASSPGGAMVSGDSAAPSSWRAVDLSAELQLPRVWSDSVQALELDEAEHEGWQRLRHQLAMHQGVEVHDETHDFLVMHRLLGYPDERRGDMPLACELLARGHALGDDPPRAHPFASAAESYATRWRLLLQLSADDELGWSWGGRRERLYVWIDRRDLAAGDFTRVHAFVY